MKRPRAPIKPYPPYSKPMKPIEFFPPNGRKKLQLDNYNFTTLADVLKATEGVDPKEVSFEAAGYGGCDDISVEVFAVWPDPDAKPTPNPYYKQQMANYEREVEQHAKAMEKYKKDLAAYETRLEKYEKENKKYLVWYYNKQLEALQK